MTVCLENDVLEELLTLLKLEKIEENIFRGQSQDLGFGSVFAGQELGQALPAEINPGLPNAGSIVCMPIFSDLATLLN